MTNPGFRIVDDFLEHDDWEAVWTEFQVVDLHPVARGAGAWKLDDGVPLGGQEMVTPRRDETLRQDPEHPHRYPTGSPFDHVLSALIAEQEVFSEIVGEAWQRISARPYVYPHGTGLSWHRDDSELYTGAFIYYAHPYWNAHWGGELLIAAETDPDLPIMAHRFENEAYSEALLDAGVGSYIQPKPNRLVVLGSAPHAVVPVSAAAGQNVRASISGFFLRGE